jgi:hypothetical protein
MSYMEMWSISFSCTFLLLSDTSAFFFLLLTALQKGINKLSVVHSYALMSVVICLLERMVRPHVLWCGKAENLEARWKQYISKCFQMAKFSPKLVSRFSKSFLVTIFSVFKKIGSIQSKTERIHYFSTSAVCFSVACAESICSCAYSVQHPPFIPLTILLHSHHTVLLPLRFVSTQILTHLCRVSHLPLPYHCHCFVESSHSIWLSQITLLPGGW